MSGKDSMGLWPFHGGGQIREGGWECILWKASAQQ